MNHDIEIRRAAELILAGSLVVFPTETVYGLGANALSATAVQRIFDAKGRPADNPLIVHIPDTQNLQGVAAEVGPIALALLSVFSPGPFTVVLPAHPDLPRIVTAGLSTVAVRIPRHPVAQELLAACRCPIAAPSANRSGEPSPTSLAMARRSLGEIPAAYLDGGRCEVGLESTVVATEGSVVTILRPGAVTAEQIREAIPQATVQVEGATIEAPRSPGVRHRHYQPTAPVVLFETAEDLSAWLCRQTERVAVICSQETANALDRESRASSGAVLTRVFADSREFAHHLYAWFHELDQAGVTGIAVEYPQSSGIGVALRDRLLRSSAGRFVDRGDVPG
jgi:L-threonylcarbamoyladenylate synthase